MTETKTIVVFLKYRNGSIFALFPYEDADVAGMYCTAYAHLGQHHGADYNGYIRDSFPAKPEEYADLKKELESIGYDLIEKQKKSNRR
ncbi:MAG: hypothetical protein WC827_03555 [Candidatus Paceibacterota bacterium]|jgi:hypothetical protein